MTEMAQPLESNTGDRFGLTMFGSLLFHMVIILGVTFAIPKLQEIKGQSTLEITLVQTSSQNVPDKVDYLAQANQEGGGNSEQNDLARNPLPVREIGETNRDQLSLPAIYQPRTPTPLEKNDLMSAEQDAKKLRLQKPTPDQAEAQTLPTPPGLFEQSDPDQERARLSAEVSRFWQDYQKQPKRKYLNASTRQYKYAAYMDAWRARVERIGNLNYPEQARKQKLSGSVVVDVALNASGRIEQISVLRSSGQKLLDDAASRIVEMAGPFEPFPPEIRHETDILHITRTWQFNGGTLNAVQ